MCSTTPQCIEKRQQTIEPQRARLNKGEGQVHQAGAPQPTSSGTRARLQLVVWLFHSELTTGATHLPTICWTDQPKTAYYGKSKATLHSSRGSFYVAQQNTPRIYLPVSSTHHWMAMIVMVDAPLCLWSCVLAFKINKQTGADQPQSMFGKVRWLVAGFGTSSGTLHWHRHCF